MTLADTVDVAVAIALAVTAAMVDPNMQEAMAVAAS